MNAGAFLSGAARCLMAVLLLASAGCATSRIDWTSRVGVYTYDQTVLEIGPPDKEAKLADGTIVAEWLTHPAYSRVYGIYGSGYPYYWGCGPLYPPPMEVWSPDYYLRLVFGADGKLKSWKRFAR
jgi:hypothetical protein